MGGINGFYRCPEHGLTPFKCALRLPDLMGRIFCPRQQLRLLVTALANEDLDAWTDADVNMLLQAFPVAFALKTSLLVVRGPQLVSDDEG